MASISSDPNKAQVGLAGLPLLATLPIAASGMVCVTCSSTSRVVHIKLPQQTPKALSHPTWALSNCSSFKKTASAAAASLRSGKPCVPAEALYLRQLCLQRLCIFGN
eukprot:c29721_g1_i1 orf=701-1021(+)